MSLDLNIRGIDQLSPVINKAVGKANTSVKKLETGSATAAKGMAGAFKSAASFLAPLGIAAAATIAVKKFSGIVTETIKYRDEIAKASKATGVSVEFLSSMGFAAERSGASMESLNKGIKGLLRNQQGVKEGLSQSKRVFDQLGVSALNTDGSLRQVEDVFGDVAEQLSKMTNEAEKAALAQELFGRAGIELVPLLEEGRSGIQALREEAAKLGIVFDEKAAKEAEAAADAITNFNTKLDAFNQKLAAGVLPFFTRELASLTALINGDVKESFRIANMSVDVYIESLQKLVALKPGDRDFIGPINQALKEQVETQKEQVRTQEVYTGAVAQSITQLKFQGATIEENAKKFAKMAYVDVPQLDLSLNNVSGSLYIMEIAITNFAGRLAEAVVYGENLSKILSQILKQLASRALAGFFGAVIGSLVAGPAGAAFGFELGSGFSLPGRASGGSVGSGRPFIVGERGPEVFVPNQNGRIVPNNQVTNSSNVTVNIYTSGNQILSKSYIEGTLVPAISRAVMGRTAELVATSLRR